jgi:predicted FMN-binding regulatory protein PaiB
MNYGKLTAGTTKTAIDTAKPSEKGEIITYLSRMGDVLHDIAEGRKIIVAFQTVHAIVDGN